MRTDTHTHTPGDAPARNLAALGVAVSTALLYTAALATGRINFWQWDNLETFLPAIWNGHSRLLQGSFPLWNAAQNLGEPLHAYGTTLQSARRAGSS